MGDDYTQEARGMVTLEDGTPAFSELILPEDIDVFALPPGQKIQLVFVPKKNVAKAVRNQWMKRRRKARR